MRRRANKKNDSKFKGQQKEHGKCGETSASRTKERWVDAINRLVEPVKQETTVLNFPRIISAQQVAGNYEKDVNS